MTPTRMLILTIALVSLATTSVAQDSLGPIVSQNDGPVIRDVYAKVNFINRVPIPSKADGPLTELNFEEGDIVTAGDTLARVDATEAEKLIELRLAEDKKAELVANNDINLRDAKASKKIADAEVNSFRELESQGAIPWWELKKKEAEADQQGLRVELAIQQGKEAQMDWRVKRTELELARIELSKRTIESPVSGFIEERVAQQGQWVQAGTPIAVLIQMDRLRVEGRMNALNYPDEVRKGAPVELTVYSGEQAIKLVATIGFVSMEVDSQGLNRVWAEIENQHLGEDWKFKPGMKAEMTIRN